MKQATASLGVGLLFGIGLGISGMTQPQRVIGFLDLQNWDPTLIFVMIGAVGTHMLMYPFVRKRHSPLLDTKWHVPTRRDITPRLLVGSAIFGVGWGLGGYCPGPALTSLASGETRTLIFVAAMLTGMWLFTKTGKHLPLKG